MAKTGRPLKYKEHWDNNNLKLRKDRRRYCVDGARDKDAVKAQSLYMRYFNLKSKASAPSVALAQLKNKLARLNKEMIAVKKQIQALENKRMISVLEEQLKKLRRG